MPSSAAEILRPATTEDLPVESPAPLYNPVTSQPDRGTEWADLCADVTNSTARKGAETVGEALAWARPSGKKQLLGALIDNVGVLPVLKPLHDRGRRSLVVLAYHRVVPREYLASNPLDLELISATDKVFDAQMRFLLEHMTPVPLSRVCQSLRGEADLPDRAVAITFDDGYRDTYSSAFPILQRYRIPATIFITTGNVDSGERFWFETAAQLMKRLPPESITLAESTAKFPSGDSVAERRESLRKLQNALKGLPDARRTELLAEWSMQFAAYIEPDSNDSSLPLTWDQIRAMAACGLEFGSHTVTHPNLRNVMDADLEWELLESKRTLETQLQRSVETIAYPIGTASAYDSRVIEATRLAGFSLGVSYRTGANWLKRLQPFELRRQGINLNTSLPYFRVLTQLPGWFS